MAITLRRQSDGSPVGAGDELHNGAGVAFVLDSWSGHGDVYAYPKGHTPRAPTMHFKPHELGLYFGPAVRPLREAEPGVLVWYLSEDEALDIHMALRYLRDNGLSAGAGRHRITNLLRKIGKLPGHKD